GGGASALVESEERLDEGMDQVHRQIGTPVLTSLKLEADMMQIVPGSVGPARLPGVVEGTPGVILGRCPGMARPSFGFPFAAAAGGITVQARAANGEPWSQRVGIDQEAGAALASVWARGRLRDLEDRYAVGTEDQAALEQEIVGLSLTFGVMCRLTSFVAV